MTIACAHEASTNFQRLPELDFQRVRNDIVKSSDLFFLSSMENDNTEVPIAAGGWHLWLQKRLLVL